MASPRDVAQPGSVLAWGARGPRFKSGRPDQRLVRFSSSLFVNAAIDCSPEADTRGALGRGCPRIRDARIPTAMATHSSEGTGKPHLSVRGISLSFSTPEGAIPVLDRISFDVPGGSWKTIIGPSGCGKTTLLRVLSGLLLPGVGSVKIGPSGEGTFSRAAYMPQSDTLLPWRTALDNAILAAEVDRRPLAVARAEARALFGRFGLERFERLYPFQLSGGMRQRIALIRTFLAHRDVLLLDEPLGSLDALSRVATQDWLLSVWEGSGKTVLLVTHDVEEAIVLSDQIVLLSSRPARVVREVPVVASRPRPRGGEDAAQLKGEVLDHLAAGGTDA